jgi:hypothetical protein
LSRLEEAGVPIAMFVEQDGDVSDSLWAKFKMID